MKPLYDDLADNPWEGSDGQWYFWDETEDINGPFPDLPTARRELFFYTEWLNGRMSPEEIERYRRWLRWSTPAWGAWLVLCCALGYILWRWYAGAP